MEHTDKKSLKDLISKKILILDGAMGTMLQKQQLTESDFRGNCFKSHSVDLKGNNEVLSITKPEAIEKVHRAYLDAGADIIECNTFNANSISQKDYGLEKYVQQMNRTSARIAKNLANEYSTPSKPRFVAGSIGPTTKSASISPDVMNPEYRDVTFDELVEGYKEQITVLAEEDVDVFLIETIFDTLNAKAAIYAIKEVLYEQKKDIPIMLSVTLTDKSGRTLSGQTIDAFYYSIEHANPLTVGLNCSMGIESMIPYIEALGQIVNCGISVYANAGLPDEFGQYKESPQIMVKGYEKLAKAGLINIAGGCCGTTPEHIKLLDQTLKNYKPKDVINKTKNLNVFAGLEGFIKDKNHNFITVGERSTVTGSRKFAECIRTKNYPEAINITRKQIENGANIIDISMDSDLSDAKYDMVTFLNLIAGEPDISKVPVMVDSSDFEVIEAALKCLQSKPIVNSISLKCGEAEFIRQAEKIRDLGGQIVVMAFDEKAQATEIDDRIEIVSRAYGILTEKCKINPTDIIFDLNIFPIATGIKEHNNTAINFINALKILKQKYPRSLFSGGISNISFSFRGIKKVREAIHSVFLYHATKAGLDMGIINAGGIIPYENIEQPLKTLVEDTLLNRSDDAYEKLLDYSINLKSQKTKTETLTPEWRKYDIEKRLQYTLIKGDTEYIDNDIKEALKKYTPIDIIEKILLDGMNQVGELFNSGKLFLPQVVKSSRIMKEIIDKLQTEFTVSGENDYIGTIILATVKGDVHDIGKNILALILTCNKFKVVDLGVMVNCSEILKTAKEYNADIIALSGLITPSLDEMQNVAEQMEKEGFKLPALMVGGATTSKRHTAIKIAPYYNGLVVHTINATEAAVAAQKIIIKDEKFIQEIKEEQASLRKES